jgi:hypothetical protein
MDLQEMGWVGVGLIGLVQNSDKWQAVVKTAMNIQVP